METFCNTNAQWCAVLAGSLFNCGVRTVVVSPGSRNTPLTFALAACSRLELIPVLDERSAAFFALGLAKSTHKPIVLLCTSGTAAANYLPAVVEARMSRTPLIVLTADRPLKMQNCHAGQTIPQEGIFSEFPVYEANCEPKNSLDSLKYAREVAEKAVSMALAESAPVHINLQFDDPLPPQLVEEGFVPIFSSREIPAFAAGTLSCERENRGVGAICKAGDFAISDCYGKKILIVAGTVPSGQDDAFNVNLFAQRFSAPILSDVTYPLRHFASAGSYIVERYDSICRAGIPEELRPELIIQIGTLPESKFLRKCLAELDVPVLLFNYCGDNTDALHRPKAINTKMRFSDFFKETFFSAGTGTANAKFLRAWQEADYKFRAYAERLFQTRTIYEKNPREPEIARFLCQNLPEAETAVFIANGMPIRDMNAYCPSACRFWAFHNRGANGIDGTLSTALGIAHGCMEQTFLYTGDLSLLHDTNGFLLAPNFRGNLTIILQNNDGGNIFRHLPISENNLYFEKYWLTPQKVNFEQLLRAYGCDYCHVETLEALASAIKSFRSKLGIHLIEINTDGNASREMRQKLSRGNSDCEN